jgi:hypothetical protein
LFSRRNQRAELNPRSSASKVVSGVVYPVTLGALGGGFAGLYSGATDDDRGEPTVWSAFSVHLSRNSEP